MNTYRTKSLYNMNYRQREMARRLHKLFKVLKAMDIKVWLND